MTDHEIADRAFARLIITSAALFAALIALIVGCSMAHAHDDGRFANSDLKPWFDTLHNANGLYCCDETDGARVEAPDWRQNPDGSYSVRLNTEWQELDPKTVLTEPNRAGYAVLWQFGGRITCFIPGPQG